MRYALLYSAVLLLLATAAMAQERPIFDPDDFVDPRERLATLFISRLVAGGAANFIDDYRPLHHDAGFLLVANSLYVSRFQLDYKHSEVRGGGSPPVLVCGCTPPIYFPTAPGRDSTPAAPPAGSKDTLQFAFYGPGPVAGPPTDPPVMLRYRLSWSRQPIDTVVESFATGQTVSRLHGREQSIGLDADTYFRIGGHDVFGSLLYARTVRSGTTDNRSQNELAYMVRFPGVAFHDILLRATLAVGGVSNRGGTTLNLVSPAFEAFWHDPKTRANLHLVWNPQTTNSGTGGWETHNQVAFFVDRALYVHLFRSHENDTNR